MRIYKLLLLLAFCYCVYDRRVQPVVQALTLLLCFGTSPPLLLLLGCAHMPAPVVSELENVFSKLLDYRMLCVALIWLPAHVMATSLCACTGKLRDPSKHD